MLGIQHGYYNPTDWQTAGKVDLIVETGNELFGGYAKVAFFTQPEEQPDALENFKEGPLRMFLTICEKMLESNGLSKYIIGDTMTIADFAMCALLFNCLKNQMGPFKDVFAPYLMEFPAVGAYSKRMESEMSKYLTKREAYPM